MTQAEQLNCTFEPQTASLRHNNTRTTPMEVQKMINTESNADTFYEKLGKNLSKLHPEVIKTGKLKRAKQFVIHGDYEKALNCLGEGFNITSLKKRFDPSFLAAQAKK